MCVWCVCVCVCVCVSVCVCVCIYTHMYTYICIYIYIAPILGASGLSSNGRQFTSNSACGNLAMACPV